MTPAERRAKLLGAETIRYLREKAKKAPPLTPEQEAAVRSAFKAGAP
jgi:hypothetical protein